MTVCTPLVANNRLCGNYMLLHKRAADLCYIIGDNEPCVISVCSDVFALIGVTGT